MTLKATSENATGAEAWGTFKVADEANQRSNGQRLGELSRGGEAMSLEGAAPSSVILNLIPVTSSGAVHIRQHDTQTGVPETSRLSIGRFQENAREREADGA
jgi:hypothetical protein